MFSVPVEGTLSVSLQTNNLLFILQPKMHYSIICYCYSCNGGVRDLA